METRSPEPHLTDAELFALAAPASGEPEPLPRHLSRCEACARSLQEWRGAMRDLGHAEVAELEDRPEEDWAAAREATMSAVRRARPRRGTSAIRWAAGIAAALLLVAIAMPGRRSERTAAVPVPVATAPAGMGLPSAADRADDALLRDAEYLAQGGDDRSDLALEDSL